MMTPEFGSIWNPASVVGLMSFSAVQAPLGRIVETSLPEMELAKRLSGESGAIAAAAPAVPAAPATSEEAAPNSTARHKRCARR